ncbi:MAG: SusD/RagB family nutrient-binding outer membrane lipoprotein [Aureispira sp.]|nr:SusD/RagB family nutrient-binding outer membrane lipoprotein [Aureispira sp.]
MRIIYIVLVVILSLESCGKLSDLNINPNQPSEVNMDNILPGVLRDLSNTMVTQSYLIGNNAAQLTAKSLRVEVDIYNWGSFDTWTSLFDILRNVYNLEDIAKEDGNQSYEAVAIILRSYIFSVLTDAYSDIPYMEAVTGNRLDNFKPIYDSQEYIYTGTDGLLAALQRANDLLTNTNSSISGDILYNNNLDKWKRFGNSLRLRLLLHISKKINVSTQMSEILSTSGSIMESNSDNAALNYLDAFPNQYPIIALKTGDFDAVRIGESLVSSLKKTKDPRLGQYARPTDATINQKDSLEYLGWTNGADGCDTDGSRLGLAYYDYPNHPLATNKAQAVFMSYSEVQFIIAEAIQQGWVSGDAASYYKRGIENSITYHDADLEDFGWTDFNDFYNNSGVAYNGTQTQLWEQKWVALFFHGLEPYFEVRRWLNIQNNNWSSLGFLVAPCNNNNNDLLPSRFLYPSEEKELNGENYNTASSNIGGDNINSKMWSIQ